MSAFDQFIPRRGTGSLKWDRRPDLEPLWVADMDFTSPEPVIKAIQERVSHGVFGYAVPHDGINDAVLNYLKTRHEVSVKVDDIVHLGGLVPAKSLALRAFGSPGDHVMTCTPVYPPFLGVHKDAEMVLDAIPHCSVDGKWQMDFPAMEAAITPRTKVFLFCNPQNPLGRVFSQEEVIQVAEFCERHELILVSDEIHCDLILEEKATPFYSATKLSERFKERVITLLSPSKTYNIAGLGYAYAVIENDSLRRKFNSAKGHTLAEINCISYYAAEAAYNEGEPWRKELIAYLKGNYEFIKEQFAQKLPKVNIPEMEATYLCWMGFSGYNLENPAEFFEKEAGVFLSDGAFFGAKGHCRLNFGCSREYLESNLNKLFKAMDSLL